MGGGLGEHGLEHLAAVLRSGGGSGGRSQEDWLPGGWRGSSTFPPSWSLRLQEVLYKHGHQGDSRHPGGDSLWMTESGEDSHLTPNKETSLSS